MKGNRLGKLGRNAGWVALGAAAGSTAALLMAPVSGKAARKRIGNQFRAVGRSTARQLNQTRRMLAKQARTLRNAAAEKIEDTREWLLERMPAGNGKHHPMPRRAARH